MAEEFFRSFEDAGYVAFINFAVACAAVAVSLISLSSSRKSNSRLLEIEEARDAAALKDANETMLRGRTVYEGGSSSSGASFLLIENTGPGTARNISVSLDGEPASKHPWYHDRNEIEVLGPHSSKELMYVPLMGSTAPRVLKLTWSDGNVSGRVYETEL